VEREEEGVFVREASIECGDRSVGAKRDLANMDVVEILIAKQEFGDVEQTFETLMRSRLSRRTNPMQLLGLLEHVSVLRDFLPVGMAWRGGTGLSGQP